jgi:thiamine-monophosphate kinase
VTRPRPLTPRDDPADSVRVVGEFGVIDRVLARAGTAVATEVGPGDDAAVLRTPDGRVVATTDVLVEGRHFRRDWSSPEDVGHKAAAANLADVAAMGGVATALLVGLACPPETPTSWLEGVAAGLAAECAPLGAAVVGGDTVASAPDSAAVVLSVTALGDLGDRPPVLRSGARPGDVVALAGRLGWSACGLAVLRRGFSSPVAAVNAHRRPQPPYAAGPAAAAAGATAMCDVSDGLLADVGHLAAASGVVFDLDRAALVRTCLEPPGPLQQVAAALGVDPLVWVLTGGEDHALVASFPASARLPEGWAAVGAVREARDHPGVLVDAEPVDVVLQAVGAERAGHVHFG